jgi:hypothetical protein
MPDDRDKRLAGRPPAATGPVEDYEPDEEDPDAPSAADVERFSGVTVKCPECGSELFDDVAVCWKCGRALTVGREGKVPLWALIAAAVIIAAMGLVLLPRIF